MFTATPSTALAVIQPAFTDAGRLDCRAPAPGMTPGAPGPGPSVVANPEIGRNYRGVVASAVANRI